MTREPPDERQDIRSCRVQRAASRDDVAGHDRAGGAGWTSPGVLRRSKQTDPRPSPEVSRAVLQSSE